MDRDDLRTLGSVSRYSLPEIMPSSGDWNVDDDDTGSIPIITPSTPRPDDIANEIGPARSEVPMLRKAGRRPRVRRVTRVVRHIDPWSTFKVGLLFSLVGYVVSLTSGVLLWEVAERTGTLDNIERWFTQFGWETFEFKGDEIFDNAWVIGLFGVVAVTGAMVLTVTLFNLISDVVGGVRVSVLEEEVVERTVSSRRYVVRRTTLPTVENTTSDWDVDDPVEESTSGR